MRVGIFEQIMRQYDKNNLEINGKFTIGKTFPKNALLFYFWEQLGSEPFDRLTTDWEL